MMKNFEPIFSNGKTLKLASDPDGFILLEIRNKDDSLDSSVQISQADIMNLGQAIRGVTTQKVVEQKEKLIADAKAQAGKDSSGT